MAEDMQLQAEIDALKIVMGAILVSTGTSLRHQGNFHSFIDTSLEDLKEDQSKDELYQQCVSEAVQTILDALPQPQ